MPQILIILMVLSCFLGSAVKAADDKDDTTKTSTAVTLNTQVYYDEASYAWPGAKPSDKPKLQSMLAKPGRAISPILPYNECVYIDNISQDKELTINFKTSAAWSEFKNNHPDYITLTPGCRRQVVTALCRGVDKILMADRLGAIRTIKSEEGVRLFQCSAATDPDGKGSFQWREIGNHLRQLGCAADKNPKGN